MNIFIIVISTVFVFASYINYNQIKNKELKSLYFSIIFYALGLWCLGLGIILK